MVTASGHWLGQLSLALESLDWPSDAEIVVEIGGTSVYEIDGAGTKWAPVKGTRKYNKDAFIVIKRKTPVISSNAHPPVPEQ